MGRLFELAGLTLCGLGALCLIGALAVDLDSTAARVLMAAAAALFLPGAVLALAWVRYRVGPPE